MSRVLWICVYLIYQMYTRFFKFKVWTRWIFFSFKLIIYARKNEQISILIFLASNWYFYFHSILLKKNACTTIQHWDRSFKKNIYNTKHAYLHTFFLLFFHFNFTNKIFYQQCYKSINRSILFQIISNTYIVFRAINLYN